MQGHEILELLSYIHREAEARWRARCPNGTYQGLVLKCGGIAVAYFDKDGTAEPMHVLSASEIEAIVAQRKAI